MHLLVSEDDSGLVLIQNFHNILFPETTLNCVKSTKNALEFLRETSVDYPAVRIPKKWLIQDPSCRVGTRTAISAEDQHSYIHKRSLPDELSVPSFHDTGNSVSLKAPGGYPVSLSTLERLRQGRN